MESGKAIILSKRIKLTVPSYGGKNMKPALFSALLSIALLLLWSETTLAADVHKEVQAALDYQVPDNNCKKPKKFARTKSTSSSPPLASGSINLSGGGDADVSDTDSYTKKRLMRKEKRWLKCVSKYKSGLLNDMARLKASAQYGISQVQANTILGNMRRIQDVYMSPDGVLVQTAKSK